MKMRITVFGDGSWGTTLALLLHANGHRVTLWSAFAENAEAITREHENQTYLPGIAIPAEITVTADPAVAFIEQQPEAVVLAVPSQFLGGVLQSLNELSKPDPVPLFINVAKGIELSTCLCPHQLVAEYLGDVPFATLSGPSHAEEVTWKIPTAVVAASRSQQSACQVRDLFMNDYFRVYTSHDILGVELGGALKNVYAIAAGICDGMGLGDNSKAALLTRAITEMARLGRALGGEAETFSGLSGVGDLIVTCISQHSRNRRVGEEIGKGKSISAVNELMGKTVAEGVKTTRSAVKMARQHNVEAPIIEEIYQVLYQEKAPQLAVRDLMTREPKAEKI